MSNYEKQNFQSGQILKASELNHMEDGIYQLSEEVVKSVNGIMPDENGEITFDKPFAFLIEHSISVDFPEYNSIKCINKTLAEIREAFFYYKKHAIVGRLNRYNADLDEDDYRELKSYTIDYNGSNGGFRYILRFDDDIPPYICDINANTITLDPNWVAPVEPIAIPDTTESNMHLATDENGNKVWVKNPVYITTDEVNRLIDAKLSSITNAEEVSY